MRISWLFEVKIITTNNYIESHLHTGSFNQDNFHSTIHLPPGHVKHNSKQKFVDKVGIFYDTNIAIHTSISIIR